MANDMLTATGGPLSRRELLRRAALGAGVTASMAALAACGAAATPTPGKAGG